MKQRTLKRRESIVDRAVGKLARPWQKARIDRILGFDIPPNTTPAERAFDQLQAAWPSRTEYGYDAVSIWKRAAQRSATIVALPGLGEPGRQVLEVGAGDGMVGIALAAFGHSVTLADETDWRTPQARSLPFFLADCCRALPLPDDRFDSVVSFNSFEHLPDPRAALLEIHRVLRPGGVFHAEFGPLFASPWGLHAYCSLHMPYPQFLFGEAFYLDRLKEIGIRDLGAERSTLQYLNQWKIAQFEDLWKSPGWVTHALRVHESSDGLKVLLRFPESFRGRGLNRRDLVAATIQVTLIKQD